MSNSIGSDNVKLIQRGQIEFYLLKTVNRMSPPYPVNSLEALDYYDALIASGWTSEYISEKTVILTAPAGSNVLQFSGRAGSVP